MINGKSDLRKWAKDERQKLEMSGLSKSLVVKLKELDEYKNSKNVMIFYPLNNEVNLLTLLDDRTKNFYLPKICGDELLCCPYEQNAELEYSCFKTKEPVSAPVEKSLLDLVIVPALAVDKSNYRLGYGRGFYDRFLADISCHKIVCIPKCLIVDTIYPEFNDIKMDTIVFV